MKNAKSALANKYISHNNIGQQHSWYLVRGYVLFEILCSVASIFRQFLFFVCFFFYKNNYAELDVEGYTSSIPSLSRPPGERPPSFLKLWDCWPLVVPCRSTGSQDQLDYLACILHSNVFSQTTFGCLICALVLIFFFKLPFICLIALYNGL